MGESMTLPKISNCAVNYSVFAADNLGPPRVRQFSPSSPAPLQMRWLRSRSRRRRTPTDIQIIDLRAEHVCARERVRERERE